MKHKNNPAESTQSSHTIPDVEIINLEDEDNVASDSALEDTEPETEKEEDARPTSQKRFRINMHIVLVAVIVLFFVGIIGSLTLFHPHTCL